MAHAKHIILGVHLKNRLKQVGAVQKVFSEFGCVIKTRLGLHDVGTDSCGPTGLILLELAGDAACCRELEKRLGKIAGLEVKKMTFDHN